MEYQIVFKTLDGTIQTIFTDIVNISKYGTVTFMMPDGVYVIMSIDSVNIYQDPERRFGS